MLSLFYLLNTTFIFNDAPEPWQKYFQDSASPSMQSLVDLNDRVSFSLIVILVFISWMLSSIAWQFSSANNKLKYKYENHGIMCLYTIYFNRKHFTLCVYEGGSFIKASIKAKMPKVQVRNYSNGNGLSEALDKKAQTENKNKPVKKFFYDPTVKNCRR